MIIIGGYSPAAGRVNTDKFFNDIAYSSNSNGTDTNMLGTSDLGGSSYLNQAAQKGLYGSVEAFALLHTTLTASTDWRVALTYKNISGFTNVEIQYLDSSPYTPPGGCAPYNAPPIKGTFPMFYYDAGADQLLRLDGFGCTGANSAFACPSSNRTTYSGIIKLPKL